MAGDNVNRLERILVVSDSVWVKAQADDPPTVSICSSKSQEEIVISAHEIKSLVVVLIEAGVWLADVSARKPRNREEIR